MGGRPIIQALSALPLMMAASGAGATVRTEVVEGSSLDAVPLAAFDPARGTLLEVEAALTYRSSTGYTGFTPASGFDRSYNGYGSFGGLTFAVTGNGTATDLGNGRGYFTVNAAGTGSWSAAADLARLTAGTGGLMGSAFLLAPAPGTPLSTNARSVSYKVTYTYDDGLTAAGSVPEPATWAMMAGGFAAMGFALRSARRRRDGGANEVPTGS